MDIASLEPRSSVPSAEHGGHNEEHTGIYCSNPRSPLHSYRKRDNTFIWTLNHFWIESAFSLVMLALVVSTLLFGPQKNLKIFGISKILVIGVSFAVQLLLGILGSALKTEALPAIPILSFLLASAATATLFATGASESHASTIENQISSKSQSMQNLELQLRLLLDESPSELRASMTSFLETSSLADPASCEASAQVEDEISSALRDLSQSIESNDIEGANSKILRMTSLIRQRAALVKASKDS